MRLFFVTVVFVIELWAVYDILGSDLGRAGRLRWISFVLAVPVIGVLVWHGKRPRPDGSMRLPPDPDAGL